MKKLHLITEKSDSLRPYLQYIQIRNSFAYVTNCHTLAKFPVNEIFGNDELIQQDEEIYFSGQQWKKQNFSKAYYFKREGLMFSAYDKKNNLLGMIKALIKDEFIEIGRFPDCETVIPSEYTPTEINSISFSHDLYFDLIDSMNIQNACFYMEFLGKTKVIMVKPNDPELTNAILLIMPIHFNN